MLEEDFEVQNYLDTYTDNEPALLAKLRRETHLNVLNPRMLSGHYQGRVLSFISKLIKPKNILEVGTFTGYATICLAEGLVGNGEIHTIEIDEELQQIAEKYFVEAEINKYVKYHLGDAITVIKGLKNISFDLVFLDADKERYPEYFHFIIERLNIGGVIIADNVLWSGKVFKSVEKGDKDTKGITEFNQMVKEDRRLEKVMLSLRDGLYLIRKICD